jgi:Phage integrase, N-terminal SAM-like domain
LRWREAGRYASRTFDRKKDAEQFDADRRRRRQLGQAAIPEDVSLRVFVKTYWRLHAIPNLADSTRDFYSRTLSNHIIPRLGDYGVRELTPRRLARFRESLEREVGAATVRKAMAILQSILSFAVAEELIDFNAAASVRKPRYERAREPHIFLPAEVELIRIKLGSLRDRTLVSVLASRGLAPKRWSVDSCGKTSASGRSATATSSATGSASRRCSGRWRRTYANGSLRADGPVAARRCSRHTTEGFGTRTTGRTDAAASGNPGRSARTSVGDTSRSTAVRLAAPPPQRGRGISAQATSRCAFMRACR